MANRRIGREILDNAPDEEASRSLLDLRRINRWLGGRRIFRNILDRWYSGGDRFTVLDVGAASGDMAWSVKSWFPHAVITSLDRLPRNLVTAPHPKVAGDAFRLPFAARSFDVVFCSLFLHHFTDADITTLLRGMHAISRHAVVAIDLERHPVASAFIPATSWLFRWHPITVHDAPVSVDAGFKRNELLQLARRAELPGAEVQRHDPWFRLSLVAQAR